MLWFWKNWRIVVGLAGLVVIGTIVVFAMRQNTPESEEQASTPPPSQATTTPPGQTTTSTPPTPLAPRTAPAYRGEAVATLTADPNMVAQVGDAVFQKSRAELQTLATRILQNPYDTEAWMRVAYIKHFYNDDIGARDAYEYMHLVAPTFATPFYNVALIYAYNLGQPQRALPKFEKAISLEPSNALYYIAFADFYRDSQKDLVRARDVLLQGEARVKTEPGLYVALGAVYRDMGNTSQAISYYEKALAMGNLTSGERQAIELEINRLRATSTGN